MLRYERFQLDFIGRILKDSQRYWFEIFQKNSYDSKDIESQISDKISRFKKDSKSFFWDTNLGHKHNHLMLYCLVCYQSGVLNHSRFIQTNRLFFRPYRKFFKYILESCSLGLKSNWSIPNESNIISIKGINMQIGSKSILTQAIFFELPGILQVSDSLV